MKPCTQITINDREQILKLSAQGFSQREIGAAIGKNQSNISRELRRKKMNRLTYSIAVAQVDRNQRASLKGRDQKLTIGSELLKFVRAKMINLRWSPEQVSGYIKKNKQLRHISHETIYRYIYSLKDPVEKELWIKSLRQRQKKRRSRKGKTEKRGKIPNRVSIHDRPEIIDERKEGGHWEGDLIVGKNHASAIGTSVERVSRKTIIVKLPNKKTSDSVVKEFSREMMNVPLHLRKSLTYDNGHEMSHHQTFSRITGMDVYFADPGCPGQRGTNENTNGLIRDFFPKGTNFNHVPEKDLKRVEKLLNQRPRKILNFSTPDEIFKNMVMGGSDPPYNQRFGKEQL
jgi:IS30 family transposase